MEAFATKPSWCRTSCGIVPYRLRLVLVGLLVLSLPPAAADLRGGNSRNPLGAAPQAVLFDALTISASGDLETGDKRTRTQRSDQTVFALNRLPNLNLPKDISFSPPGRDAHFTPPAIPSGITIRAPPPYRS